MGAMTGAGFEKFGLESVFGPYTPAREYGEPLPVEKIALPRDVG